MRESEEMLRERIEKSPLRFFIRRFNGNDLVRSDNELPRPSMVVYKSRKESSATALAFPTGE